MGNALDGEAAAKAKQTAKASTADDDTYLAKAEKAAVKDIFVKISTTLTIDNVASVFGDSENIFFSECVYNWMVASNVNSVSSFENMVVNLTRVESNKIIKFTWGLLSKHPKVNKENKVLLFFTMILIMAIPDTFFADNGSGHHFGGVSVEANRLTEFFTNSMNKQNPNFNLHDTDSTTMCGWINNYSPHCPKVIESYVSSKCFKDVLSPSFKPFLAPILISSSSAFTQISIMNELELLPLALSNPNLQDIWQRLYSSAVDGTSFNRIVHHILGYEGPTCIIIKCRDAETTVLGSYSADRWKEHNKFYGSSSNMLFTLKPKIRMYRPKPGCNGNYQYLNTTGYSLPHGLGLGGTIEGFRLFIPESLEQCTAGTSCPTYESGKFVDGTSFEIDSIEIWGCGGSEKVSHALKAQLKEREIMSETIQRARKVDRGQFFGSAFDQEFFLAKTMQHRQQQADRETCEVDYDSNNCVYKGNINMN